MIHRLRWLAQDVWRGLHALVCLLARGPRCGCGDRALTEAAAVRSRWRWGTYYAGDAGWSCLDCQLNDREPQQW